MPRGRAPRSVGAWVFSLLSVAGCSKPEPELHPFRGTVAREAKAVAGGGLYFMPEGGDRAGWFYHANVSRDGTFVAETEPSGGGPAQPRPGLPAGRYKVTYHPPSNGSKAGLEVVFAEPVVVEPGGGSTTFQLPAVMPGGLGQPRDDDPAAKKEKE